MLSLKQTAVSVLSFISTRTAGSFGRLFGRFGSMVVTTTNMWLARFIPFCVAVRRISGNQVAEHTLGQWVRSESLSIDWLFQANTSGVDLPYSCGYNRAIMTNTVPCALLIDAGSTTSLASSPYAKYYTIAVLFFARYHIIQRAWQRVAKYWSMTKGFRIKAVGMYIFATWCEFLAPRRCTQYFIGNIILTAAYPDLWCFPVLESSLFLLNASAGRYMIFYRTKTTPKVRRCWIEWFPAFVLLAHQIKVTYGICAFPTGTIIEVFDTLVTLC